MKIRELMTTDVKSCRDYSTLNTAAQLMWDHDIGCLPVVDHDGKVIGMLTDRDVCMSAFLQGSPLTGASVIDAMSKQVFSCSADDDIEVAERLMQEKQVHRVPVLDSSGHPVGMVSLNDIARHAAHEPASVRQAGDAEVIDTVAAVCAPRHRIIQAEAA